VYSCGAALTRVWCPRSLALVWSQPGEAKPRFSSTLSLKQKPKPVWIGKTLSRDLETSRSFWMLASPSAVKVTQAGELHHIMQRYGQMLNFENNKQIKCKTLSLVWSERVWFNSIEFWHDKWSVTITFFCKARNKNYELTVLYGTALNCIVLCWIVLYCTEMCYAVLYFTVLYSTVMHWTALCYDVLYCTQLKCTVLRCTLLYSTALYCTTMHCTILYCTELYCAMLNCIVLYCSALHCTIHYFTELYCAMMYFTALNCTLQCCTLLYCPALYCTALHCT